MIGILLSFVSILVLCATCLYTFIRLITYFEFKHCLHCPLKSEDVEDTYTCFLEELKFRKENNVESKPKI